MRNQSPAAQRALGEMMGALAKEHLQTQSPERKAAIEAELLALTKKHGCTCSGVRSELKTMWRSVLSGNIRNVALHARAAGWLLGRPSK